MFLGIEIGGTKLQLGLGRGDGTIVSLWRGTVNPSEGGEGIRKQIVAAVPELLARAKLDRGQLRGVGIGFGGPTDDATRTVIKSHQIAGWDGFPLADWISDLVGVPAVLCNDADVAGLGEALFGAGKGMSPVFYMTIGSGIGGGLIIDGQIYRGVGRGAAEIGHLQVFAEGTERDHYMMSLEECASGWAIADAGAGWVEGREHRDTPLRRLTNGDPGKVTGEVVAQAAREGDEDAMGVIANARKALAQALCQVIVLLCPRRIVIGGGVSLMGEELLFEPLRRFVARDVFKPFAGLTDIVPAALGEEMVVHGALALARQKLGT
ncbi:MAG: ROK family protein [Planctomycetes bacterium]|nr:ROK family protein [Planctomycetota bacterium]